MKRIGRCPRSKKKQVLVSNACYKRAIHQHRMYKVIVIEEVHVASRGLRTSRRTMQVLTDLILMYLQIFTWDIHNMLYTQPQGTANTGHVWFPIQTDYSRMLPTRPQTDGLLKQTAGWPSHTGNYRNLRFECPPCDQVT